MMQNDFKSNLNLDDFDYNLPTEKIAQHPNNNREESKLLVFDNKKKLVTHSHFNKIYDFVPAESMLIINSTKVIPARFFMQKETGGRVEVLCVSPISPSLDPQITINAKETCTWNCIIGGPRVTQGMKLKLFQNSDSYQFEAKILSKEKNKADVQFSWNDTQKTFSDILQLAGKVPLPPYIKRENEKIDSYRYQTVYAKAEGSIAAPTAGLHFSDNIIKKLESKKVAVENIILHVGPGTFVPIEGKIEEHQMHFEQIFVKKIFIENLIKEYQKQDFFITATGTTSLRTLETLYWLGVKSLKKNLILNDNYATLEQAYPYSIKDNFTAYEAFTALLENMEKNNLKTLKCNTQLFIVPPYNIKTIKALITNFHLPKSTLLLLVSSFIGIENCKKIYAEALQNQYKFLSYGDTSLLLNY